MAATLPSNASPDQIQEELEFVDVLIASLDQGSDDYDTKLAEFEATKADYARRLAGNGANRAAWSSNMGLDGAGDWWQTTMGAGPSNASRGSGGFAGSSGPSPLQQNGLKRSLQQGDPQYPSKRPTPEPSNAGTPTSPNGSFEMVEHPLRPSQSNHERAQQRQLQAEAAAKRRRDAELLDEDYARRLSQPQPQSRSGSSSSLRPNVQTTLNHNGSYQRPVLPPLPTPSTSGNLLSPSQEQQLRNSVRPGQPESSRTPQIKPERGPSLQHEHSPLARRPKQPLTVVDLTNSDEEDDLTEVAPSAFSPSNRQPRPPSNVTFQNQATYTPTAPNGQFNRPPPTTPFRSPAVQPPNANQHRYQMPGTYPGGGIQVPSSANGYVYGQPSQPPNGAGWMQNVNPLLSNAYNGVSAIAGNVNDKYEAMRNMLHGTGSGPTREDNSYDSDDDGALILGSRPVVPSQRLPNAGYADPNLYRERFDQIRENDPAKTMEEINELLENIRPDEDMPEHLRIKTPEAMSVQLHKYQELGLTWLQRCEDEKPKGGILADDMGLGKTIQMLSLIVTHKSDDPRRKTTLIVAPVALMRQWKQEIESKIKPRHKLTVHVHHGQAKKKSFQDLRFYDVVLTTFGSLAAELKRLELFAIRRRQDPSARPNKKEKCVFIGEEAKWYRVVLDEAQCIKNSNTQTAKAAARLDSIYRFCMTGTPMMNNVNELWALIHFLRIKPFCNWAHFRMHITQPLKDERYRQKAMQQLQAVIRSLMLRRTKQSKFEGKPILVLPERTTNVAHPTFSEDEAKFYEAVENKTQLQFNKYVKANTVGRSYSAILVLLLRLRQAACHPHLIKDFGVSAAAGVTPEELVDLAKQLGPQVVERIKETEGNFECPVCMDACPNPAIFIPCGHDTCRDCFAKIADTAARDGEDGGGKAKCPKCRGDINSKKITDFESFKRVHMPEQLTEEERSELQKMFEDSDTEAGDSDSESDSDDEDGDDVNANGDLDGFVVKDGEEEDSDSETEEDVKAEGADDDDVIGSSSGAVVKKRSKGKGKAKDKAKAPKKSKKAKGKRREKGEKKKKPISYTLAELKKQASRSAKGRAAYMKRLNEDWVTSAKIEKTMEKLNEIMNAPEGEKVLIFSQWTSLLDLLECPVYREGWGYRRYDGSMNAGMRGDAVDDFRDTKKDVRIMLVSLKAGNAGLNLNMASQVIILDPFWNPFIEEQAIDRAHRIGQTRPVQVHRMLIENTVEDRIIALQEKKRQLIGDALDEKAGQNIARLGQQELAYLFGVTRNVNQRVQYTARNG